jgi:hypothetical protein
MDASRRTPAARSCAVHRTGRHERPGVRVAPALAVWLLLTALVFVSGGVPRAAAGFDAVASGSGTVDAQSVPAPAAPVAVATGPNVSVGWNPVTFGSGTPVAGYVVERLDGSGVPQVLLAGCAGVLTSPSCTEVGVPPGIWSYRVRAVHASWTGPVSDPSAAITVLPTTLTITSPQPITALPATVTGTLDNFVIGETVTYHLDSPTGPVLTGSPTTITSASETVSVAIPAGTSDAPHSIHVVGSLGSLAAAAIVISIPPVVQQVTMHDVDVDGRVDEVRAVFDEALDPAGTSLTGWTLTNVPSGGTLAAVSVSGNTATLSITEGVGAPTTAVGAFTVALTADPAGIRDLNGHAASFTVRAPIDRAAPAPVTMAMQDGNNNGRVDRVAFTWSETLAATTTATAPWTLANVPSGGVRGTVSMSGTSGLVRITEGTGPLETGVGSFTVALTASATGVRDAAGNQSAFPARSPTDAARPRVVSIADTDGAVNGRVEPGDTLSVTFTEAMDTTTLAGPVTVTLTDPNTTASDTLTVTGFTNGARSTGGNGYVSTNNVSYSFASSSVSYTNGNRTVVITIGPTCSGTCAAIATQTTNATFSFLAATTFRDLGGNTQGTAFSFSTRLF